MNQDSILFFKINFKTFFFHFFSIDSNNTSLQSQRINQTTNNNFNNSSNLCSSNKDLNKSNKSLTKNLIESTTARSNSKEDKRVRTSSGAPSNSVVNSASQSPANFRKVAQIFTSSQMMG